MASKFKRVHRIRHTQSIENFQAAATIKAPKQEEFVIH